MGPERKQLQFAMATIKISVAEKFGTAPGPRYEHEGLFSGEKFRKEILLPHVKKAIEANQSLIVNLDGTSGYGTSFLEEAFGGLIRYDDYSLTQLQKLLIFESVEEPYLIEEIEGYMTDAANEKHE